MVKEKEMYMLEFSCWPSQLWSSTFNLKKMWKQTPQTLTRACLLLREPAFSLHVSRTKSTSTDNPLCQNCCQSREANLAWTRTNPCLPTKAWNCAAKAAFQWFGERRNTPPPDACSTCSSSKHFTSMTLLMLSECRPKVSPKSAEHLPWLHGSI